MKDKEHSNVIDDLKAIMRELDNMSLEGYDPVVIAPVGLAGCHGEWLPCHIDEPGVLIKKAYWELMGVGNKKPSLLEEFKEALG